jgi:hypothetical protein
MTPEETEFAVVWLGHCSKNPIFLRYSYRIPCLVISIPAIFLLCQIGVVPLKEKYLLSYQVE